MAAAVQPAAPMAREEAPLLEDEAPLLEDPPANWRLGKATRLGLAARLSLAAACLGAAALAAVALAGSSRRGGAPALPPGEASLDLLSLHGLPTVGALHEYQVALPSQPRPHGGLRNASSEPAILRELWGSRRRRSCSRLLDRLDVLDSQSLSSSRDSEFPDALSSIAEAGEDCGDSAAGIHKSCSSYNNWATFQAVSNARNKHFDVMSHQGPEYQDIGQGELGTCYFLAALASIAHSDPKVIEDMFVDRHLWAHKTYTTRWLLDGKKISVKVDNKVPAAHGRYPYFVQPSDTGEWWPVILEKTWAKIFGNYKAVEGGMWANAVLAITMAPVIRHEHKDISASKLFDVLREATRRGWPMGSGSGDRCQRYGLAQGHAYSVLNASHSSRYGKVVMLYNPWKTDHYRGDVPNPDKHDGVFTMTIAEFHDAFEDTTIASVYDHYQITSKQIQTEASAMSAWEFHVSSHDPVYVTLSWPGYRIVRPCEMKHPSATLVVTRKGGTEPLGIAPMQYGGVSSITVEVTHGSGRYTVLAGLDFPANDEIHEGHLTVYSSEAVRLTNGPDDTAGLLAAIFAPTDGHGKACEVVFIVTQGAFVMNRDKLVYGFPTYWSSDGADFAYWVSSESKWLVITHDYWEQVKNGELWSFEKLTKDDMSCGCADAPDGVGGFKNVGCNEVKGWNAKFSNVKCSHSEHSHLVQRFCPRTCNADFCQSVAHPTSRPTTPAPPSSTRSPERCTDSDSPGISLGGRMASCSELGDYCHSYKRVELRCCETCAKNAERGGISNEECEDHTPPGIRDSRGNHYENCAALKDACHDAAVRERCCTTCKRKAGLDGQVLCTNTQFAWLQPKDGTELPYCKYLKLLCGVAAVANECCSTCR